MTEKTRIRDAAAARSVLPDLPDMGRTAISAALERFAARPPGAVRRHLLAVDATCGNGHDTLFLARALAAAVGPGAWSVLSFDVQPAALAAARLLLGECGVAAPEARKGGVGEDNVYFLLQGHERLNEALAAHAAAHAASVECGRPELGAVMYNLGFLPRSDKRIITEKTTTLASLRQAAEALAPGGVLAVHAYAGHQGGSEEREAVAAWCAALPSSLWIAASYAVCNKPRNPETLFILEKRQETQPPTSARAARPGLP